MGDIVVRPIGYVKSTRINMEDDNWDEVTSEIELTGEFEEDALKGIEGFSHAEIIFHFHRAEESKINRGARHPRNNEHWPLTGIFAQRAKHRPNLIGSTIVRIIGCNGNRLQVSGLDAVDDTPVLDIKPVMLEFLPRGRVFQPKWSHKLMRNYWRK